MDDTVKEHPATAVPTSGSAGKSKLRYPLRSATKAKEENFPAPELPNSSVSKRVRSASSVSKSVGVLDLSSKEKSAKPPRRLSIPAKPGVTPVSKPVANITPISEARAKRSANAPVRSETPVSDISRTSSRKKFNMGSSASYWLNQIKLFESSAMHNISLGLFKLALEAGCEPLEKMRNQLKAYVSRHKLSESELAKELFESYSISESQKQVQVAESCSQVPEDAARLSDNEVHSTSSTMGSRKLRPRSLNADTAQISTKETTQKNATDTKTRASVNKSNMNSRNASDTRGRKLERKLPQKTSKQEATKGKDRIKKQGKTSDTDEGSVSPSASVTSEENKENMPLEKMRNQLKAYVSRHKLSESELAKELFESYSISESQKQVQVAESCSQVPEDAARLSDNEVHSTSSTMGSRKLRPRSLNADTAQISTKETTQKNATDTKTRASVNKSNMNSRNASDTRGRKLERKLPQKTSKQEATKGKDRIKKQGKTSDTDEGSVSPSASVTSEENKENMDAPPAEDVSLNEVAA